ncbi:MAG: type II secretion system protein [Opitutae bacterium]|nr:type II secretion system protein [Opitutae bacterium]
MAAPLTPSRLIGRQRIPRSIAGVMGLVELMVVVAIISFLIAGVTPVYQRVQRKARASAIANDFRVFASSFQAHTHETGGWPVETPAGVVPAGMTNMELKTKDWERVTAIGGHFDWEKGQMHNGTRYAAALAITDTANAPLLIDLEMFRLIDEALDDGNLETGNFRLGENDCPLFILEN